jgi:hypothetical protein
MLSYTISKTADQLIPRPISRDSPDSASTGGTPSEKSQKAAAPHDAKVLFPLKIGYSDSGSDCLVEDRFELV